MTNHVVPRWAPGLALCGLVAVGACQSTDAQVAATAQSAPLSFEQLAGVHAIARIATITPPQVEVLNLPTFPGAYAIWGSLGRDAHGHIWFGLSSEATPQPSAHLFEYSPETNVFTDRGDVVAQLKRTHVYRDGEGQAKIHSRIVQGPDGYLYFASMDEEGEHGNGSHLPTWGGHLWRYRPGAVGWEHLAATPEALIAVSGVGRWIYALGYFDHVLYQFDTKTHAVRSQHIGSIGGHISRNFLTDENGHAYVPRLKGGPDQKDVHATLVEIDSDMHQVGETPLDNYSLWPNEDSHGIVSFQYLADHSIVFATDLGFLYHVEPRASGPAAVEPLGFFHAKGASYVASMFTDDGHTRVMGVSQRRWNNDATYEWLVYDFSSRTSNAFPFDGPKVNGEMLPHAALYGSMVRDDKGHAYVGGTYQPQSGSLPLLLRINDGPRPGQIP